MSRVVVPSTSLPPGDTGLEGDLSCATRHSLGLGKMNGVLLVPLHALTEWKRSGES